MSNLEEECIICHEYLSSQNFHTLECNHSFHTSCICTWFRRGNASCPMCRDIGSDASLCWPDALARASELRRQSRRKTAPKRLKELVENVKKAETKVSEIRKELTQFKRNNQDVFKLLSNLRTKYFNSRHFLRTKKRILGTYTSAEFPLPNIRR